MTRPPTADYQWFPRGTKSDLKHFHAGQSESKISGNTTTCSGSYAHNCSKIYLETLVLIYWLEYLVTSFGTYETKGQSGKSKQSCTKPRTSKEKLHLNSMKVLEKQKMAIESIWNKRILMFKVPTIDFVWNYKELRTTNVTRNDSVLRFP